MLIFIPFTLISMLFSQGFSGELWAPFWSNTWSGSLQSDILPNPALSAAFKQGWVNGSYQKLWWGLDQSIGEANLSAFYNDCCYGGGLWFQSFSAGMEKKWTLYAMGGGRLIPTSDPVKIQNRRGVFGGIGVQMMGLSYNRSLFQLAQPNDPLLSGKLSKIGFSFTGGLAFTSLWGTIYAGAYDFNLPDMTLQGAMSFRPTVQAGYAGQFGPFLAITQVRYSPRYSAHWLDITPHVVLWFDLGPGAIGIDGSTDNLGISAVVNFRKTLFFMYRYYQPLTLDLPSTHRFGFQFALPSPEPVIPESRPIDWIFSGKPIQKSRISAGLVVENNGKFRLPSIPVAFRGAVDTVVWTKPIHPQGYDTVWVEFVTDYPGEYFIEAVTNRKNASLSAPVYTVERDAMNNYSSTSIHIFSPPQLTLEVEHPQLKLIQLFSITEDEPIVPIFFFPPNDSTLDARFDRTIKIISERLSQNPDAKLLLLGYRDEGEDDLLYLSRAREVSRRFIKFVPSLENRIETSQGHNFTHRRAEKEKFQGTKLGAKYTVEENRRVELRIVVESITSVEVDNIDGKIDERNVGALKNFLTNNPDGFLAISAPTIKDALETKQRLALHFAEFQERLFSQKNSGGEKITIVPSLSGVIYRPPMVIQPKEGYKIKPDWDEAKISTSYSGEVPIEDGVLTILDRFSKEVFRFPFSSETTVVWDWKVDNNLPNPDELFVVKAFAEDTLGQQAHSKPETLSVSVENVNEIKQKLILIQFVFAGDQSESEYTQARMEYIARRVLERISAGSVDVAIIGHTDIIGTIDGNKKLSLKRAEQQSRILQEYLCVLLGMPQSELNQWLAQNNSRILVDGKGFEKPFTITKFTSSGEETVLVGDNSLPEGRVKNRRVEIHFIPRNVKM